MQQQVAGYLKNEITPEEYARQQSNCWLVIANSLFMFNAAKLMLIRSTKLITKRTKTNGMMRVRSLRIVVASIGLGTSAGLTLTPYPRDGFGTV